LENVRISGFHRRNTCGIKNQQRKSIFQNGIAHENIHARHNHIQWYARNILGSCDVLDDKAIAATACRFYNRDIVGGGGFVFREAQEAPQADEGKTDRNLRALNDFKNIVLRQRKGFARNADDNRLHAALICLFECHKHSPF